MTPAKPAAPSIEFHSEAVDFELAQADDIRAWLTKVAAQENKEISTLNVIFCSDDYLHQINVEYLQHDTLTDVISFPYSDIIVEGDIFISIDRIADNAKEYGVSFEQELRRVIVHGTLHLIGFDDKSAEDKQKMTQMEDRYLAIFA
ncbi:MAG: rRNA maturation RNase YbeY [Bacteroidota bacterium]